MNFYPNLCQNKMIKPLITKNNQNNDNNQDFSITQTSWDSNTINQKVAEWFTKILWKKKFKQQNKKRFDSSSPLQKRLRISFAEIPSRKTDAFCTSTCPKFRNGSATAILTWAPSRNSVTAGTRTSKIFRKKNATKL